MLAIVPIFTFLVVFLFFHFPFFGLLGCPDLVEDLLISNLHVLLVEGGGGVGGCFAPMRIQTLDLQVVRKNPCWWKKGEKWEENTTGYSAKAKNPNLLSPNINLN